MAKSTNKQSAGGQYEPIGMSGNSQVSTFADLEATHNARDERVTTIHAEVIQPSKAGRASNAVRKALQISMNRGITTDSVPPPFRIDALVSTVANSSMLPQHITAMATNIDGFGHSFEAKLDPTRDDLDKVVMNAMILEGVKNPKKEVVNARCAALKAAMAREQALAVSWFDHCVVEDSFVSLRKRTRIDLETTGNAYWEVLRDARGMPQQIMHVPVSSIEVTRLGAPVEVPFPVQVTPLSVRRETRFRRFHRFVQAGGARPVWYKEHGDPRLMSDRTGKYFDSPQLMKREEPEARPATEIRHWKIYSTRSDVYGVPRWVGATNAVVGTTKAEEVNYLYFDNKSIPPLALLVSGGSVSDETIQQLKDVVENDIQGTKNFHRILILQAQGAVGSGTGEVKIALQPLTSAQLQDGQFMEYLKFNSQTVGSVFRLPPLYRGDVEAFNRATAEIAVQVAEEQVFQPERGEFDFVINRFFLPDLDILYWSFKSNGPNTTDLQVRAKILDDAAKIGALTVNEYRARFGQLFDNRELEALLTEWADLPVPIAVALAQAKNPGIFVDVQAPEQFPAKPALRKPLLKAPSSKSRVPSQAKPRAKPPAPASAAPGSRARAKLTPPAVTTKSRSKPVAPTPRKVPVARVLVAAGSSAAARLETARFLDELARDQDEQPLPPLPTKINSRTKSTAPALTAPLSRLSSSRAETAKDGSHAVLILPDAHFPYQDAAAMEVAEATAALVRPRRIVILGDWLDCAGFSSHPVKSAAEEAVHDYQEELQGCAAQIDRLYKLSGAQEIVFIEGNHEQRVERECRRLGQVGKAIHSMLSPSSVLGRNRPWLTWVPYVPMGGGLQHYEVANDLWAIHGWSIATHAAAKHLQLSRTVSIVHGHTHRQQLATTRLLDSGKIVKAWSPGCLSSMQPAWHHGSPTDWVNGVSIVFCTDDRRKWTDYTVTIENGSAVLPGGSSVKT